MRRDVVIVGGGPAGSSLGIRLARRGFRVAIVEREEFPREKLCGEFISPECFTHFQELGVDDAMIAAGGSRIDETVFYARDGTSIIVPSLWFDSSGSALGLSRAAMDSLLLNAAREAGAELHSGTAVTDLEIENGGAKALMARSRTGERYRISADLYIDATGRSAVLSKLGPRNGRKPRSSDFVAFKAHLTGADGAVNKCEIYSFNRGYGGLNMVEDEKANFCFILRSAEARGLKNDPRGLFKSVVSQNSRAAATLSRAQPLHDWLAVAVDRFGRKNLHPAANVFCVGDAGAFIDPFTGSGMLMAFESSKILGEAITSEFPNFSEVGKAYREAHEREFSNRLAISRLIRNAAYRPNVASLVISLLSRSKTARRLLARATRPNSIGTSKIV